MLYSTVFLSLVATVLSHPLAQSAGWGDFFSKLEFSHTTENALETGCPEVVAIIAKGSMEPGNIVSLSVTFDKVVTLNILVGRNYRPSSLQDSQSQVWSQIRLSGRRRWLLRWYN
jgi:hypothetical protein